MAKDTIEGLKQLETLHIDSSGGMFLIPNTNSFFLQCHGTVPQGLFGNCKTLQMSSARWISCRRWCQGCPSQSALFCIVGKGAIQSLAFPWCRQRGSNFHSSLTLIKLAPMKANPESTWKGAFLIIKEFVINWNVASTQPLPVKRDSLASPRGNATASLCHYGLVFSAFLGLLTLCLWAPINPDTTSSNGTQ